jgi:uncharacterized protein (TIGR03435 family)
MRSSFPERLVLGIRNSGLLLCPCVKFRGATAFKEAWKPMFQAPQGRKVKLMRIRRGRAFGAIVFSLEVVGLALSLEHVNAQTPGYSSSPEYEVVSVRQNVDPNPAWRMFFTADGVTATAATLHYAIREAYGNYDSRLWSGGPSWITQRRFDIQAKFDPLKYPDPTLQERRQMLRHLLADRFKVAVHPETRVVPLYALVVAKNGSKIPRSKPEEIWNTGIHGAKCLEEHTGRGLMELRGCSLAEFTDHLSTEVRVELGRQVVDRTGLEGRYNFNLHWTPATENGLFVSSDPFFFTAVKEQLGLELKPVRGPVQTFVIDRAEMPSEN